MYQEFKDKVVLITGAASGIGKATAMAFATEGALVIISDINEILGKATATELNQLGGKVSFLPSDVSKEAEVKNLIENIWEKFGRLDVAVNNAGIGGENNRTADYSSEEWDRVIAVNQTGVFYCMKYELQKMQGQGEGAIVNISSIAGLRGLAFSSAYSASKHAVIGLTKSAALEYARKNIRINAVCPVFTLTPLFEKMFDIDVSYEEKLKKNIPMQRYGEPEDIACAILWLCSSQAGFVTGQALALDGGMTAG